MTPHTTLKILWQFLKRDIYVYKSRFKTYSLNYLVVTPLTYIFAFAYIQPNAYFGSSNISLNTTMFVGNITMLLLTSNYNQMITLLHDLEADRFIDYQISVLRPRLLLIQMVAFSTLFSFTLLIPFFPVAKLLLGSGFDSTNMSWIKLAIILFLGALYCATYMLLAVCIMKGSKQISRLWIRCNLPLLVLGGFWAPRHILATFSPLLGKLILLNPFVYITEGLRAAIIGGPEFLPFYICAGMLIAFASLFLLLSFYFFKKKVDHI